MTKRIISVLMLTITTPALAGLQLIGGTTPTPVKKQATTDRPVLIGEVKKEIKQEVKKEVPKQAEKPVNTVKKKVAPAVKPATPTTTKQDKSTEGKTASEIATTIITMHEGLRLYAYWDHKGRSIGYGTRANSTIETITQPQARERMLVVVSSMYGTVTKDFPNKKPNEYGALMSLMYNCQSCYNGLKSYGITEARRKAGDKVCTKNGCTRLAGLTKRRANEWALYAYNVIY